MSDTASGKKSNTNKDKKKQQKQQQGKSSEELKAKEERRKQYEAQMKEKQKGQQGAGAEGKSKAQLKAERRAKQEAQRAEKSMQQSETGNVKLKPVEGKANNDNASNTQRLKKFAISSNSAVPRVPSSVQMDNEKVKKKLTKTLAKQNVPQRSSNQKKVQMFSHLHQYEKDLSLTKNLSFTAGTIHPVIIKLGLQYAEGIITGSNARCIAMLCALKKVINDYTTPPSKELSRDLESKIKPCISFLIQCRHLSVSMGNAIKYLKQQISQCSPGKPEAEAKSDLVATIDDFIEERILLAGKAIQEFAGGKINNSDKILIYGFSSLIVQILRHVKTNGKDFHVVVVDSRPDFPGRETLKRLLDAGIKCSYVLINSLSYIIKEVTTVLLGTHALLANGSVMARTGTAMVAMVAKANNVPVLACCETYKFCERVQSDSFVFNELGDPDAMVRLNRPDKSDVLTSWRDMESLYLLNLVYDVTPSDFIDMAITEIGMIPCTSVPVVLRVKNTAES